MYEIRKTTKYCLTAVAVLALTWRAFEAAADLSRGNETPLLAFPFTVIFPVILISLLLLTRPTKTREGLLMRFGTVVQLLLIICLPDFALYLALGFPFVFLSVELFENHVPKSLSKPLSKLVLS